LYVFELFAESIITEKLGLALTHAPHVAIHIVLFGLQGVRL